MWPKPRPLNLLSLGDAVLEHHAVVIPVKSNMVVLVLVKQEVCVSSQKHEAVSRTVTVLLSNQIHSFILIYMMHFLLQINSCSRHILLWSEYMQSFIFPVFLMKIAFVLVMIFFKPIFNEFFIRRKDCISFKISIFSFSIIDFFFSFSHFLDFFIYFFNSISNLFKYLSNCLEVS